MRLLLALAIAVAPQVACAQALELACAGTSANGGPGGPEHLRLKIDTDGGAQLQLPPSLSPGWGGPQTWRKVDGFLLTDTQLSGRYRFGLVHSGRFVIDRRSGAVAVTTRGGAFTGACESTVTAPRMVKY